MTKVTLHYPLTRLLNDDDLENVARVHSTYGMARVRIASSASSVFDTLTVDYDASRLMKKDVEAVLLRHALPIEVPLPV